MSQDLVFKEIYIQFVGGHDSHSHVNKRYRCQRYPFVAPEGEIVCLFHYFKIFLIKRS